MNIITAAAGVIVKPRSFVVKEYSSSHSSTSFLENRMLFTRPYASRFNRITVAKKSVNTPAMDSDLPFISSRLFFCSTSIAVRER